MHLYGMTGIHSSCTTIQRDRCRDFDKLKEVTIMYNMGEMEGTNNHIEADPFEEEKDMPGVCTDMVGGSYPDPDFTTLTV